MAYSKLLLTLWRPPFLFAFLTPPCYFAWIKSCQAAAASTLIPSSISKGVTFLSLASSIFSTSLFSVLLHTPSPILGYSPSLLYPVSVPSLLVLSPSSKWSVLSPGGCVAPERSLFALCLLSLISEGLCLSKASQMSVLLSMQFLEWPLGAGSKSKSISLRAHVNSRNKHGCSLAENVFGLDG